MDRSDEAGVPVTPVTEEESGGPSSRRWYVLVGATAQQAGLTVVRFGLPALAPFMRTALGLSLTQVGMLLASFDLGALVGFLPTGMLTSRRGERWVLTAGALITGLLTLAAARGGGFLWIIAALFLAGFGYPSSQTAGSQAVMLAFPARGRGLAMGIRQAGLPIGGLMAALALPGLAGTRGWPPALAAAAGLALLSGAVAWLALGSTAPTSGKGSAAPGGDPPRFADLARNRTLWIGTVMACLFGVAQFSLLGYLPLYLVDRFHWTAKGAAQLLILVHAGGIAGRLLWGHVSDRLFGARRQPVLLLLAGAGVLVAAVLVAWPRLVGLLGAAAPAATAGLALAGGLVFLGWNGLYVTTVSEAVGARGSALGLALSMTALYVSTMGTPLLFGAAVDRTGSYGLAWAMTGVAQGLALATGLLLHERLPAGAREGAGATVGERGR
ncbi:MFS transporter [Limnochorda pilosa]|uniref:MFS transporter n=1 Tax=Limnochorda pilosa TaxID=1555112 RepID=A0A0K2SHC3_LIMPI|nr:MFS transporter [Limnochorda pilosa]BAS26209.1 MFS transporter [Limnochorda pilosa]